MFDASVCLHSSTLSAEAHWCQANTRQVLILEYELIEGSVHLCGMLPDDFGLQNVQEAGERRLEANIILQGAVVPLRLLH